MPVHKSTVQELLDRLDSKSDGTLASRTYVPHSGTWTSNPCSEIASEHTMAEWEAIKKERDELKAFIETTMDKLIDDIKAK